MYSYSSGDLKSFLDEHVMHLLDFKYLVKSNFLLNGINELKSVKDSDLSVFSKFSGVYVFYCLSTSLKYVGSSSNVRIRLSEHMADSRPEKAGTNLFYNYVNSNKGWENFSLSPLFSVTNYLTVYHNWLVNKSLLQAIPLEHMDILDAFTQFELRVVEQSVISSWNCELNSTQIVNFTFINWIPNDT